GLFLRAIARCTMAWSCSFSKSINGRKCRGFVIGFLVFDWVWSREFPPLRPNLVTCGEVGRAMPGPTIFSAQRKRCLHRKERARAVSYVALRGIGNSRPRTRQEASAPDKC